MDLEIENTRRAVRRTDWICLTVASFSLLTSSMHSPVDLLYLLWNLSSSETEPLILFHDTSGFGSPVTLALKTASFPKGCTDLLHFYFFIFFSLISHLGTEHLQKYTRLLLCYGDVPSVAVIGFGARWKSGVLCPSGMFTTYCVISTPGILDLFLI